jgi:hypothetical protein
MESDELECGYLPSGSHHSQLSSELILQVTDLTPEDPDPQTAVAGGADLDPLSLLYESDSDCEEIEGGVFSQSIEIMNSNGDLCQVNGFSLNIPLADMGVCLSSLSSLSDSPSLSLSSMSLSFLSPRPLTSRLSPNRFKQSLQTMQS